MMSSIAQLTSVDISTDPTGTDNLAVALVIAAVSIVGVVVGSLLTHLLSSRLELRRERLQWERMLYDRYSGPYTEFLATVDADLSPAFLRDRFAELRRSVPVPAGVVEAHQRAQEALSDRNATRDEKLRALGRLGDAVLAELNRRP